MTWKLIEMAPDSVTRPVPLGLCALQNKASGTFLSLATNEYTVGCWPSEDLKKSGVKLVCSHYFN